MSRCEFCIKAIKMIIMTFLGFKGGCGATYASIDDGASLDGGDYMDISHFSNGSMAAREGDLLDLHGWMVGR